MGVTRYQNGLTVLPITNWLASLGDEAFGVRPVIDLFDDFELGVEDGWLLEDTATVATFSPANSTDARGNSTWRHRIFGTVGAASTTDVANATGVVPRFDEASVIEMRTGDRVAGCSATLIGGGPSVKSGTGFPFFVEMRVRFSNADDDNQGVEIGVVSDELGATFDGSNLFDQRTTLINLAVLVDAFCLRSPVNAATWLAYLEGSNTAVDDTIVTPGFVDNEWHLVQLYHDGGINYQWGVDDAPIYEFDDVGGTMSGIAMMPYINVYSGAAAENFKIDVDYIRSSQRVSR